MYTDEKKLIGITFMGQYKILKLIGKGGMESCVYLAEDIKNANKKDYFSQKYKYVAIKIIKKTDQVSGEQWNKILQEGITNARLAECDNIVKLESMHNIDNDNIVLIMEYVDGPTLKALIKERGSLYISEFLFIFKKILRGVASMHGKDRIIIHRDLKPENIILSKDLIDVKIADFGISSVILKNNNVEEVDSSSETSVFGTIPYITPDATIFKKSHDGKRKILPPITKQYDFHALGVIMYEMLVGEKPFELENETDPKIILYWKKYDITPMKFINPIIRNEVENIFLKLTASKEDYLSFRYDDVSQIISDIEKLETKIADNNAQEDETLIPYYKRVYKDKVKLSIDRIDRSNILQYIKSNKLFFILIFLFFILIIFISLFIPLVVG